MRKPKRAQVDTENGNFGAREGAGRRQQRSIPTQHYHQGGFSPAIHGGNDARILGVAAAYVVQNGFEIMRPHPGHQLGSRVASSSFCGLEMMATGRMEALVYAMA